jgi:hypothetical protein
VSKRMITIKIRNLGLTHNLNSHPSHNPPISNVFIRCHPCPPTTA